MTQIHKSKSCSGALLNGCRSLFDQFEHLHPSIVMFNAPASNDTNVSTKNDEIQPECHCIMDLAALVQKPKHVAHDLTSKHVNY